MIIFREIAPLQQYLARLKKEGHTLGFVPTMGALHEGHLSLVRESKSVAGVTICSIFVNPTQFNDPADFDKYPITTANDIHLLVQEQTDILFLPAVAEIYPGGMSTTRHYDLGYLETILEGSHRAGHFQGVCQVVHRLLDIVRPHKLLLGQKDYQQCMVIKKLVELLRMPVEVIIGKTKRAPSGLALSSRNLRLSDDDKQKALALYKALDHMRAGIHARPIGELQETAKASVLAAGFDKVDYITIARADTLELLDPSAKWDGHTPVVAVAAAFIGGIRLIDNVLLT
jgi:pantoate--beta-alanine ligase